MAQELPQYDTSRVFGRNVFALIIAVALAFRAHSGGWENPHPICNGGWQEFLAYLAYFILGIAFVEFLHWIAWYLREGRKWLEWPAPLDQDAPLLRGGELLGPHGLGSGLVFAMAVLWIARRYLLAPSPCESVDPRYFSWASIPGAIVFAYGALAFGEYVVSLIDRRNPRKWPPPD